MLKNYYSNDRYPDITAAEFDVDDKKQAISVFSKCHMSLFYYIMIASIFLEVVAVLLIAFLPISMVEDDAMFNGIVMLAQIISMHFIAFPVFWLLIRKIPKAVRDKSTIPFGEFLILTAICFALMQLGVLLSDYTKANVSPFFGMLFGTDIARQFLMAGDIIPSVLSTVIFAPIFEELMFRKLMIDRLSVYGDRLAVIVTSFSFGFMHGNITQFFYATMAGFVLGHVYTKTRRLSYSIGIHMLVNLFGTIPSTLYYIINGTQPIDDSALQTVPMEGLGIVLNVMLVIQALFIIIGLVMLVFALFIKKYRLSRYCDIEIPASKVLRVALFNKGMIFFIVYSVINIVYVFLLVGQ